MRFFKAMNDLRASGGSDPALNPESFRTSLFNGAEIEEKLGMARRKKLVRPIKALISFTDRGSGNSLMTNVLARPGFTPLSALIS